ncbi:MAG: 3-phosphoshikimate 1-carboxyvinyltransferase [Deltaproteobacteria bacterium]|nr:3-phosphoshikimate 1-carboxyvinyltransferase [Deltaproteobacteria bacterium]MBW1736485.1 3-phosphoshikimate 1-carboxyvinyltransferase [Deltaproteobacteria bacterium]MBW1909891.1 3-phosphoshikimate 1-carboxyvinyltransferase [Deltaproteobacteria bacterium]MBW2032834.1 3-phosphoshikimate 1-carboxyvinyltransferase [Deltaproteobacteria bacterium]MBW2113895.1 3-phosphoshikimate 1-carboxyvinyltransferase [Deltaproteobacteria bacterium]
MKTIRPKSRLNTTVRIPGSKSITHRAIIAASLAKGESLLQDFLECEDTLYTANALQELGVNMSYDGKNIRVAGTGGKFRPALIRKRLYLGNSGTSFRLLLSVVALGRGEFILTGTQRMLTRPIGPLVTALKQLGVEVSCVENNDCPPVLLKADGIRGGVVSIPGDKSSQFVSSLLLSGPYAENDVEIKLAGELVSRPYVDITINVMALFGVEVDREGYECFRIPSGQAYQPGEFTIQGDASSASYFWAAAAVTGGTVATENIHPYATRQGDIRFLETLERMGCFIEKKSDRVVVHGGTLSGIDVEMSDMPDMVPTLAAIGLFARGKTTIRNVSHLRYKESDRLRALALEWNRLGGRVEETGDGLIIHGGRPLSGTLIDPHDDHRLAMSLAVVGLRVPGIRIREEGCVNKSFSRFWELWDRL